MRLIACIVICFATLALANEVWASLPPHAISHTSPLDTRVTLVESDAVSPVVILDNRHLAGVLSWDMSTSADLDTGGSAGIPVVHSISPQIVPGLDQRQWITLNGLHFQQGAVVLLRTGNEFFIIPQDRTQWVSSQELRIFVNVTSVEAEWTVQVVNPGGQISPILEFSVGAPDITPVGTVDFGVVAPGNEASRTFIVRNRGENPASLNVSVSAPFSVVNGPFSSVTPGGQQDVIIQYSPSQVGAHDRTVTFAVGSRSLSRTVSGRSAISDLPQINAISGIVYRETPGLPVPAPGAPVYLHGAGMEHFFNVGRRTLADADGRFTFDRVEAGDYRVFAEPPASSQSTHADSSVSVTMADGMTVSTNIMLPLVSRLLIDDPMKIPIILIRGYGKAGKDESKYWEDLRDHLRGEGYEELWDPNEGSIGIDVVINGELNLIDNAISLRSYIDGKLSAYRSKYTYNPIGLRVVAHSMGGLITRQFLHLYDDDMFSKGAIPPVREVIMLGTPHAGSVLADFPLFTALFGSSSWPSTDEMKTMTRRKWQVSWPNHRGVRLVQLGGDTGTSCSSPLEPTMGYSASYSHIFNVSPFGDKANDGVVTVLSTRGRFKHRLGWQFGQMPYLMDSADVLNAASNLSMHETVRVNHTCIRTSADIVEWIGNIFKGALSPQYVTSSTPAFAPQAVSRSGSGEMLSMDTELDDSIFAHVLRERITIPPGDVMGVDLLVDATLRADVIVSLAPTSTILRVQDPSGHLVYQSYPEINSNLQVTIFSGEDTAAWMISIDTPAVGSWFISFDNAEGAHATECQVEAIIASPLILLPSAPSESVMGLEVPVMAAMMQDSEILVGSNISVKVQFPSGASTSIVLRDDGEHTDGDAGDGIFGALLSGLNEYGTYELIFHGTGTHPDTGEPYQRIAVEYMTISAPGGFIVNIQNYEAIATGGNGFAEAIRVDVLVHVDDPGDYVLSGRLVDEDADVEMRANTDFTRSEGGSQIVSLLFTFHDLPEGGVYGPFVVKDLRLFRSSPVPIWIGSLASGLAVQSHIYSPHARRIRVTGENYFGGVRVGTQAVHQIVLHNDGWDRLTVANLAFPPGFLGEFSGDIAPGESVPISVTFTPEDEGEFAGLLQALSDATAGDNYIELRGVGLPEAIDFSTWMDNAGVLPEDWDPRGDLAGDGLANLLAYAFNIHPVDGVDAGDVNALPKWVFDLLNGDAPAMVLDYRLYKHAVDITLDVQASPNLVPGQWESVVPDEIVELDPDPVTGDPRYRVRVLLGSDEGGFLRLRVTLVE